MHARILLSLPLLWTAALVTTCLPGCHSGSDDVADAAVSTLATGLRGDMDDDGQPSVNDAIAILRIVVGLDTPDGAADADGDGSTGVNDAIAVLRCVVGLADWPLGEWQLPPTDTLSGVVVVDEFVVGADDRIECTDDVSVQCQTATITGELYGLDAGTSGGDGVSVTIEAQGDVTVTGLLAGGDGADGAETDNGANGGVGGSVSVKSANGDVTIGTEVAGSAVAEHGLRAGDGGDGSTGLDGGAGGAGGSVTLDAENGTLTIHQAAGLIQIGNGGDGGDGVTNGDDLSTHQPPAEATNGGGDSGSLLLNFNEIQGVEVASTDGDTPQPVVQLDAETTLGGSGGDGGDTYWGVDPATLQAVGPTARSTAVRLAQAGDDASTQAGDGGDGVVRGGDGGDDVADMTEWGDTDARASGGDGGDVDESVAQRAVDMGRAIVAGNGGKATARGGDGYEGGYASPGREGGSARALGGRGGDLVVYFLEDANSATPGRGGDALAVGGRGGDGGPGCNSPYVRGGDGGAGGPATAEGGVAGDVSRATGGHIAWGAGGNAEARGGAGGNGGQGWGGGTRGLGGEATATPGYGDPGGWAEERNGDPGEHGTLCSGPAPQEQFSSLVSDSMTTGISQKSNWFSAAVEPEHGVSTSDITDDVHAGEGQNLALNADQSQLWVGTDNDIRMYANPLAGSAQAAFSLTPNGGAPGGWWPSSIWLDEAHDVLYATDLLGKNIYAWDNASTITANRAADRTLNVTPYSPSGITGGGADYLFVTATQDGGTVLVFDGASTLDGAVAPARRITGLSVGVAIAYDATRDILYTSSGSGRIDTTAGASQTDGAPAPTDHRLVNGSATGLQNPLTVLQCFPGSNTVFVGEAGGNLFFFTNASTMEGDIAYAATTDPGTYLMSATSWASRTGGG